MTLWNVFWETLTCKILCLLPPCLQGLSLMCAYLTQSRQDLDSPMGSWRLWALVSWKERIGQHAVSPRMVMCLQTEPGLKWQENEFAVYGCFRCHIGKMQVLPCLWTSPHRMDPSSGSWVFLDKQSSEAIRRMTSILEKPKFTEMVH